MVTQVPCRLSPLGMRRLCLARTGLWPSLEWATFLQTGQWPETLVRIPWKQPKTNSSLSQNFNLPSSFVTAQLQTDGWKCFWRLSVFIQISPIKFRMKVLEMFLDIWYLKVAVSKKMEFSFIKDWKAEISLNLIEHNSIYNIFPWWKCFKPKSASSRNIWKICEMIFNYFDENEKV